MTCVGGKIRIKGLDGKTDIEASKKYWTPEEIFRYDKQTVITDSELEEALINAGKIEDCYFRLRAKAVISLIRLSGKRRGEIAMPTLENFNLSKPNGDFLEVTFTLEKKRTSMAANKTITKSFSVTDPLTVNILEYLEFLNKMDPRPRYWLPSGKESYGHHVIYLDSHVSGRTVFNIVRSCTWKFFPHLGRESVAYDTVQKDDSITGIFAVQRALNLKRFETAFNYVARFSKQKLERTAVNGD